ncbi:UNVERIFIED_CONTAM: putative pterin-4-alpha-carbinolamine dehydratase, chloroplastic [Sesamum radiatum]|uniref:4a-hydroxytetrahydrobiopterin dehydratase n=1 Tax=Sesamum radiatum TaxID=300843 RepID=A0AAW2KAQ7_SESRA
MASAPHLVFSPLLSLSKTPARRSPNFLSSTCRRNSLKIRATAPDLLGDFGARDPFPAELESNFGEKVLGNVSTEHKILIPSASALSLARFSGFSASAAHVGGRCEKNAVQGSSLSPLLLNRILLFLLVVGWKIVHEEGGLKLQGLWKVRDSKCGEELINRITKAVESTGHLPTLHLDAPNQVRAELWTSSIGKQLDHYVPRILFSCGFFISALAFTFRVTDFDSSWGGLSINDFIVAAKIDEVKVSDLQPRLRAWRKIW